MKAADRIEELGRHGLYCSQILLTLGLELRGEANPQMVASVAGLAGGVGFSGGTCGSLTGGACLLGLYAGRGKPDTAADDSAADDDRLQLLALELVEWFEERYGGEFGGTTCDDILGGSASHMLDRCPGIVAATFSKVKELLVEEGFDLGGGE